MIDTIELDEAYSEVIERLSADAKKAAAKLTPREARYLVDMYYTMQNYRIRAANQIRAMNELGEPNAAVNWMNGQHEALERRAKTLLDAYSDAHPVGRWARSIVGIGPVLSAGLIAHIDIRKAPTVGHIWSFAGLDPRTTWKKGEKRPFNADLKVLCWKIGESFVKTSNRDGAFYGPIYRARKEKEEATNSERGFREQAERTLREKKIGKETEAHKAYADGTLPKAHIHARAARYAVKLFLSHLHEVWYWHEFKASPPAPFALAHMKHAHYIPPPNWTRPAVEAA